MRRLLLILTIACASSTFVIAQDVPAAEVFGGYSYLRTGSGYDQNSHGWNTSAAINVTNHFALKADFSGHYATETAGIVRAHNKLHSFLFGVQGNLRSTEHVNPFVHALFGVAHNRTRITAGTTAIEYTDRGFAMALGGGVDVKLNNNLSWRLFQADYLLTRYKDRLVTPLVRRNVHNFRLSTGLVFH